MLEHITVETQIMTAYKKASAAYFPSNVQHLCLMINLKHLVQSLTNRGENLRLFAF